jgi:hypothetical protein
VAPVAFRFFYIVGPLFAVWALAISAVGVMRPDFPRRLGIERAVIAVSAVLLLTVVLSATIGAKWEHTEAPKKGAEAHGKRGSPTP